tara:strand:- start:22 stop:582 length:561 start_codon:yes stop_codon:yes gene_type:complete
MTNAQSKHTETKTIVIDLSKHINSENLIKDIATYIAKQIKKDTEKKITTEDINNWKGWSEEDIHNWKGWSEEDKELLKKLKEDDGDECARDIAEDTSNTNVIKFCEYCNIGLADMEYFTVDDQEVMCEDCMDLHYEWCHRKQIFEKKITTEDINNWKGWTQTDRDLLQKINEIEEEEKKEEKIDCK